MKEVSPGGICRRGTLIEDLCVGSSIIHWIFDRVHKALIRTLEREWTMKTKWILVFFLLVTVLTGCVACGDIDVSQSTDAPQLTTEPRNDNSIEQETISYMPEDDTTSVSERIESVTTEATVESELTEATGGVIEPETTTVTESVEPSEITETTDVIVEPEMTEQDVEPVTTPETAENNAISGTEPPTEETIETETNSNDENSTRDDEL